MGIGWPASCAASTSLANTFSQYPDNLCPPRIGFHATHTVRHAPDAYFMLAGRMVRAAKGEGSAFKVGDRWRGYVTVGGRRKYFSAKTKAEAAQKRRQLLGKRDHGTLTTGRVPTLTEWLNHWLNVTVHRPTTAAMNRWVVDARITPALGANKLVSLTVEQIEQWVNGLGVSPSSQRRYLAPLRAALDEAVRRGHIPSNPAALVRLEHLGRPDRSAFSREDRDAILNAAQGWNAARWHVGLRLGLRPSEILGLTWPDFDGDTLTVRHQLLYAKGAGTYLQGDTKTVAGVRVIRLPRSLTALLEQHHLEQLEHIGKVDDWQGWEYNGEPVALMFPQTNGKPQSARMDTRQWKQLLTAAGLPAERRYKQRHTAATHMITDSGGDVAVTAKNLGHTDPAFTYRTYVHPLEERERELAERMDESAPYRAPYDAVVERRPATQRAQKPSK